MILYHQHKFEPAIYLSLFFVVEYPISDSVLLFTIKNMNIDLGLVSTLQPAQMKEMRRYIEKLVLDSGKAPFVEFRSPFSFDDTHSSAVAPIPGQKRKASVEKLQVRKRSRIASAFVCDEAEVSSCDGSDDEIDINLETEEDRYIKSQLGQYLNEFS